MTQSKWPEAHLREVLTPVSRRELVIPTNSYRLLGARWYARGLYVKETRLGRDVRAKWLYRVKAGDFVYNRLFAWKGSFAIASEENDDCLVSNEFPCFRIREELMLPAYLMAYFRRPSFWGLALGRSEGGTPTSRNRLKEESFFAMTIPIPPISNQKRLVDVVERVSETLDHAKDLNQFTAGFT